MVLDGGCLSDGRAAAGIGRYARELSAALEARDDLAVHLAVPARKPLSESRPGRFLHAQPAALRAVRRHHPDVVHALGGEPLLGVPFPRQVVTVHDVELWRDLRTGGARGAALRVFRAGLLGLYRRCAAIIAVSRTTAEEAIVTLRLDASRVHVVPHGVSPRFSPDPQPDDQRVRAALGIRGPYLLWSGNLRHHDPRKGLDLLLAALAELGGSRALALAGSPGAEALRLAEAARSAGVQTVICGQLSDDGLAATVKKAEATDATLFQRKATACTEFLLGFIRIATTRTGIHR